jgi:hypothetical protein
MIKELEINDIKSLGYDVEEIAHRVFLIKDFLLEEERNQILDFIELHNEDSWQDHYMNGLRDFAKEKFGYDDVDELVRLGKLEVTHAWVDKNLSLDKSIALPINLRLNKIFKHIPEINLKGIGTIQRQYEGAPLIAHVDNHTDPSLVYATIIYINDDYTDGELFFSNLGVEIVPPAGSLIIFPTGEEHLHGVNAPGPGPLRYVLPSFVGIKGFYEENKF